MAEIELDATDYLFVWALVILGTALLVYIALYAKTPIPRHITAAASIAWFGCVALPFLMNPLPNLALAAVIGTAAAIVIAWNSEWPDTKDRPGPMGP